MDTSHAFLVLPESGDKTILALNQRVRAIAFKQLMTFPTHTFQPAFARNLHGIRKVLADILRDHKRWLLEAVGHPDVQTPLLVSTIDPVHTNLAPQDLIASAIPPLFAALSHMAPKGIVPETILADFPITTLSDAHGHRLFRFDPAARGLLVDPMGMEANLHDETKLRFPKAPALPEPISGLTSERPFHRLRPDLPRLEFALYDSNPLSAYEAHPDKWGNAISLGAKSLEEWLLAFREALEIIRVTLPSWYEELKTSQRRFIPVGYLPERHLSASYREAPGIAYLTLCDTPITIAEAIVHETQHTKINLLSWVDAIVHNGLTCWTDSPVRPDLRPLWGVLLAVHAFVPVAKMYDRLEEIGHPLSKTERFPRRRAEILAGNHNGMLTVLDKSDATTTGAKLIREMAATHFALRENAPPPPPGLDLGDDILPES